MTTQTRDICPNPAGGPGGGQAHAARQLWGSRRFALHVSERRLLLAAGDLLLVNGAAVLSFWTWTARAGELFGPDYLGAQAPWFAGISAAWMLAGRLAGLYDPHLAARRLWTGRQVLAVAGAHLAAYLALFFLSTPGSLPRAFFLVYLLSATVGILAWRWFYATTFTLPRFRRRALVVGAGWAGHTILTTMLKAGVPDYEILGLIDDDPAKSELTVEGIPVVGTSRDLPRVSAAMAADELIVAITGAISSGLYQSLARCQEMGLRVVRMPDVYEEITRRVPVEHAGEWWLIDSFSTSTTHMWSHRAIRRGLDLAAGLVLGAVLLVVLPPVAAAIKATSPGPVFYRQVRVGRGGRPFTMVKFRSMVADAERDGAPQWAVEGDPRVTPVGRFLRRLRLDELPQVINVLRGEMSLVGPRPERPEIVEELQEKIPYYRARLLVKPGVTGWAQINYRYGNSVRDALVKLEYDLYYIKNQSIWLDLLILARTVGVVLGFKGV